MLNYGKHSIDESDIEAVVGVLRNGWLTQGPMIEQFEKSVAEYVGSRFAVAVSSLTAGLHIGCKALGLKAGEGLVTSPTSFCASSNAALYLGAQPGFVDIDAENSLMRADLLEKKIREMGNVKVIVPVHLGGMACDMEAIVSVAKKHGCLVFEDGAQALGGSYASGGKIGNCQYADLVGFSFHPVKNIACGEGGVVTTNDEELYRKLLRLRSHGINKGGDRLWVEEEAYDQGVLNPWYMEMQELGFNYRITDIQAALGHSQMKRLDQFLSRRIEIAERYDLEFEDCQNLTVLQSGQRRKSGNHLYMVRVHLEKLGFSKRVLFDKLEGRGIRFQVHYIPIPMHPYYRENVKCDLAEVPESVAHYREAISLPLFPSMSESDVDQVVEAVQSLIG